MLDEAVLQKKHEPRPDAEIVEDILDNLKALLFFKPSGVPDFDAVRRVGCKENLAVLIREIIEAR